MHAKMADHSDSDEDETFVTLGTPLDVPDEDEPIKKPVRPQDVQPTDSQGRPRFHGAFTGGFSAGYFNSVGSKEGWAPSTFVSRREKRAEGKNVQKPEDFMDEEDLGEYGIAPRKFVAGSQFTSEERRKRRLHEAKQATSDSIIPAEAALLDLIVPERLTVGVKLLRKMGWKEGQGVGPRLSRTQKKKAGGRVYGCALPPSPDSGDDLDDDSFLSDITYAPKDSAHILLAAKDNTKGLGYRGLDPKKALPGTHINLFEPPRISKGGASRKGIRGQGFGVGALEDEDEDIYALDSMSNYDMTMGGAEEDDKFGWTGPSGKRQTETPVGYVGKLLDGFSLSSKKLVQKKDFPPPKLPTDYRPVHRFTSKEPSTTSSQGVDYRQFLKPAEDSSITTSSQEQGQSVEKKTQLRDAVSRSIQLGEQAFVGSVFDLIPERDKDKMVKAKQGTIPGLEASTSQQLVPVSGQGPSTEPIRQSDTISLEDEHQKSAPLFHGVASLFKPFHKDPAKQQRYDKYLELLKIGHKDPYSAVVAAGQTEWEISTEKEEFHKAAKLYRPLAGMMAMRFTRGGHVDDEQVDVKVQQTIDLTDAEKAAEMKMYGKLTRDVLEWHPDSLVCKRFNVPNPYPGSTIVGLATIKRDKYSVFNFLNFSNPTSTEQELKDQNQTNNKSEETMDTLEQESHVDKELNKGKAMKSIFSHLVETEKETQRATKPVSFTMKSTKSNKPKEFKSIFSHLEKEESNVKFAGGVKVAEETNELENKNSEKIVGNTEKDTTASGMSTTEKSGEPTVDLFRAIFRNTDSEDSSSSEEENTGAGDSSLQQKGAGDSSLQQRGAGDSSAPKPQGAADNIMSGQTDISEVQSMENSTHVIAASSATVGVLPGSGKPIESLRVRLSPQQESDQESEDPESYGPVLPPPNSTGEDNKTYSSSSAVGSEYIDLTKQSSRKHKHKDKHKHKSKKDKKDKHKKSNHKKKNKKKEKKKKGRHDSSDDTGTSDKDTSDDDDAATDREILNRLKLMKPGHRMRAADFL